MEEDNSHEELNVEFGYLLSRFKQVDNSFSENSRDLDDVDGLTFNITDEKLNIYNLTDAEVMQIVAYGHISSNETEKLYLLKYPAFSITKLYYHADTLADFCDKFDELIRKMDTYVKLRSMECAMSILNHLYHVSIKELKAVVYVVNEPIIPFQYNVFLEVQSQLYKHDLNYYTVFQKYHDILERFVYFCTLKATRGRLIGPFSPDDITINRDEIRPRALFSKFLPAVNGVRKFPESKDGEDFETVVYKPVYQHKSIAQSIAGEFASPSMYSAYEGPIANESLFVLQTQCLFTAVINSIINQGTAENNYQGQIEYAKNGNLEIVNATQSFVQYVLANSTIFRHMLEKTPNDFMAKICMGIQACHFVSTGKADRIIKQNLCNVAKLTIEEIQYQARKSVNIDLFSSASSAGKNSDDELEEALKAMDLNIKVPIQQNDIHILEEALTGLGISGSLAGGKKEGRDEIMSILEETRAAKGRKTGTGGKRTFNQELSLRPSICTKCSLPRKVAYNDTL